MNNNNDMNPNDSSNQNGHQQRKTFERKQDKLNRLLQELKEYSKDGDNLPSSNEQESSSSSSSSSPMCRNADENQNDVSNVSVFFCSNFELWEKDIKFSN